jgi:hypothetical protein
MKQKSNITKVELLKMEKSYNPKRTSYFYNIYLDNVTEPLLLSELSEPVNDLVGSLVKYDIDENGVITNFVIK